MAHFLLAALNKIIAHVSKVALKLGCNQIRVLPIIFKFASQMAQTQVPSPWMLLWSSVRCGSVL